jgi:hypothetical protein
MASALDNLIHAYTPVLAQSSASQHAFLCSQQLGTAFMNVIMLPLFSEETLSALSLQHQQLYTQHFLAAVSQNKQVSVEHLTHTIGKYVTDYFTAYHLDLVREIQETFQHLSTVPPTLPAESNQSEYN